MSKYPRSPASETHLKRYYRNKQGESVSEIAAKENVAEQTVKDSIRAIELYRARHNVEVLNEAVVGAVLTVVPEMQKSIQRQLSATTTVIENGGKKRREPDYSTQRAAVAEVRGLIQTIQPKAPNVHATQVNLGQQGQPQRLATGSYLGMEDRLKAITQELESQPIDGTRKQLVQASLQPADDGEYEEAEPVESEA